MPTYALSHRHQADECRFAYAAWRGCDSPLRRASTWSSCAQGGHGIWWTVEAEDAEAALALLPPFVAARTKVELVSLVPIP
jgi:hypothetical protein